MDQDGLTDMATGHWTPGCAPVAVVMIALNEGHNMEAVLANLRGWAEQVFLVDSYSSDDTIDIALKHGVHVVQRRFRGFGDQWNFALRELPITAPWTMKLDPDERLTEALKAAIEAEVGADAADGISFQRRLWFMTRSLPVSQSILRVWRTGRCRFTDVAVNEYPLVEGHVVQVKGEMEHHDSPNLHHWYDKQNRYSSAEAAMRYRGSGLADQPRLWGNPLQRRMWLKQHFWKLPGRYFLLFAHHLIVQGAWRAGRVGWIWSRLRTEVFRMQEFKLVEMTLLGRVPPDIAAGAGMPDARVRQYD